MRSIGNVEGEASARKFGDFLLLQGIENQVEPDQGQTWIVWVKSDEDLPRAKGFLESFLRNPAESRYSAAADAARILRAEQEEELKAYEKRVKGRSQLFRTMSGYGFGPLTFALIFISISLTLAKFLGDKDSDRFANLYITNFQMHGYYLEWIKGLPEIRHGEIWRLVTPMFLHFSFLHIFFNMLWLRDLGSMVEGRQGTGLFLVLVLVFAAGSNLAQYVFSAPNFGGMSGVNYALVGYVWLRGKFDPGSGLYISGSTVTMMVIFALVALTGVMGGVANAAHFSGFGMGLAWGYLSSLRRR